MTDTPENSKTFILTEDEVTLLDKAARRHSKKIALSCRSGEPGGWLIRGSSDNDDWAIALVEQWRQEAG